MKKVSSVLGAVLLFALLVSSTTARTIGRRLFDAIRQVETGGSRNPELAVGDNGRSIGPYQIMEGYYNDAVQFNPSLRSNGRTYQNLMGPGSFAYSEEVMQSYMDRYATVGRLGRQPTDEDIARIHNGGPNGFRNPRTLPYWQKVQRNLHQQNRVALQSLIYDYLFN